MKTVKRCLAAVVCAAALTASADAVVGRFQTGSSVATMSRESSGVMRMTLEAPKAIDVAGRDSSRLSLVFDIRVTRADGDVGADSLKFVQGGGASMTDPAGIELFRAGSPVSVGVAPIMRRAGGWMTAAYPLAKMKPCDSGIGTKGMRADFGMIESRKSGAGTLRVSYATPFGAKAGISVNGGKAVVATLPATGGWPTYLTIDIPVDGLKLGSGNKVRIEGLGDRFHLDCIQVLGQDT